MKFITMKLLILTAILTVSLFTVSASAQSTFDKFALEKKVRHELLMLPYYDVFDFLKFQVAEGGTVVLSGQVNEYSTRDSAVKRVKRLAGVRNVVNNIEVLPLSSFDDQVRRRTYYAIASKGHLGGYLQGVNPDMHIIVRNGHVSLEGSVRTRSDAQLAYLAARGVSGSFSVTNNLIAEKDRIQ